jgi:hypothetical protein
MFDFQLKAQAKENLFATPDRMVYGNINKDRTAFPTHPIPLAANPLNLKRRIQRQRQTVRPPHPTTLQFTVRYAMKPFL